MTRRYSTSVDLTAFAPDTCTTCGQDMALRSGNRTVSSFPCQCAGIRADPAGRLHHIEAACRACGARYHDPEHVEGI